MALIRNSETLQWLHQSFGRWCQLVPPIVDKMKLYFLLFIFVLVHGELAGPPGDDALSLEADGTAAEAQLARSLRDFDEERDLRGLVKTDKKTMAEILKNKIQESAARKDEREKRGFRKMLRKKLKKKMKKMKKKLKKKVKKMKKNLKKKMKNMKKKMKEKIKNLKNKVKNKAKEILAGSETEQENAAEGEGDGNGNGEGGGGEPAEVGEGAAEGGEGAAEGGEGAAEGGEGAAAGGEGAAAGGEGAAEGGGEGSEGQAA
ncbi:golgin subfamily A member 6-like protein 2 [Penaeus vannamei]|uniref:golgin subfamily A member 6-like protein 2 n=1 Tax=Penaeus vannamei TaxID=6689 RepID=UPI00387F5545